MGGDGARAENAWVRSYPFWDAYFALVLAGAFAAAGADGATPAGRRVAAIGLLILLSVAYVLRGRATLRLEEAGGRDGSRLYAVALVCLFVPATLLVPDTSMGLAAVAPQVYMMYGTVRGFALTVVLSSGPVGSLLAEGTGRVTAIAIMVAAVAFSVLLATFIGRVSAQSQERARLIEQLDRTRDELAAVSREAGVLQERERLARDIHDTLAQGFTSISMLLQAAEAEVGANPHLELAARTARENLAETRSLVAALAPPALRGVSVVEALGRLAAEFPLPVELGVEGEPRDLGTALDAVLLRVAQEALTNVRRHASAGSVTMSLTFRDDAVRLRVTDDGRGFAPGDAASGFGLQGMRSRVEQAGGTLDVRSGPGGTTVEAEVPWSGS